MEININKPNKGEVYVANVPLASLTYTNFSEIAL